MKATKLFTLLAALFSAASLHAQSSEFAYQAKFNDQGLPANGSYDLRFALYDAVTNGNAVSLSQTNVAVPVTNGLFATQLNFGAEVFNGDARWLDIGVRTNGAVTFTSLNPRQPLFSTPYAIQSAKATTAITANSAATAAIATTANAVAGTNITGLIRDTQLSTNVALLNGSATFAGTVSASGFSGNGAGVTNVNLMTANSMGAIEWKTVFEFAPATTFSVGSGPVCITSADVNGDGKMDLISANSGAATLSVLTNNGAGGFSPASTLSVGVMPYSVTAADVNGDGKVDLISANNNSGTLSVLTNNGTGGFSLDSTLTVGGNPQTVVSVDVNGDGKVDLISANAGPKTLSVLTNNGTGGFALASSPYLGASPNGMQTADVNGDGKVDVITANPLASSLSVVTNDGFGGFVLASTLSVGPYPYVVTAADVNGDGKVDLVSANYLAPSLSVLTNDGSGEFVSASTIALGNDYPTTLTSVDANGDGKVDLIWAESNFNKMTVATNNGHGGFITAFTLSAGNYPQVATSADVNGDGTVDLICANYLDNSVSVLLNISGLRANLSGGNAAFLGVTVANNAGNQFGGTFSGAFTGNGANVTNVNATNLVGAIPDANLSGRVALRNNYNYFSSFNDFSFSVGGYWDALWERPVVLIENLYPVESWDTYNSAPALRVIGHGKTTNGVLNVTATGTGLIAQFGNASNWVASITTNGTFTGLAFNTTSDRNTKENFTALDSREVLEKVAALSISRWNFKGDEATPHVGPVAQDFYSAFGLGTDDKHIATVDADGVALAAIQGLNQKLKEKEAKVDALEKRVGDLERMLQQLTEK